MAECTIIREIAPSAKVAPTARIGPYCVIGPEVTIGPNTVLTRRVSVTGNTTIGSGNIIEEGCVIGADPQDLKYAGGPTRVRIGHRNRLAQRVTVHPGTEVNGWITSIGNDNILQRGAHVAHDCYVDDHTFLGRNVLLAGHIRVQTGAVLGHMVGLHHFVTIGRYARVGAMTPVRRDVPPYTVFHSPHGGGGQPGVQGIHEQGILAAKLAPDEQRELRRALRDLFEDEAALQTKIEQLDNLGVEGEAAYLCRFVQQSLKGVYGRHREIYRGKAPPEALRLLPPELKAKIRRASP